MMKPKAAFARINVEEARRLIEAGELLVLDVRDAKSYARGHIASAQCVSEDNLYGLLSGQPKQRPVLIYCYHGNASQVFAQMFVDFGFADVFSLDGGFEHWRQAHQDAPAPPGNSTHE